MPVPSATRPASPLLDLLQPARLTHVVDIGANPIDGDPPYKNLLASGLCRVTGFEPQQEALAQLNAAKSANETYLPFVVGDGGKGDLHLCRYSGWTSLLRPRQAALEVFPYFKRPAEVVETIPVDTTRLDDIEALDDFDMLKIDVQGAELDVFRNGREKLKNAVAIQTEISFIALYENQAGFGEIDTELRAQGFVPNCFKAVKFTPIAPVAQTGPAMPAFTQLLEADIVYVRDFVDPEAMDDEQLKHLIILAQYCYGSVDLACRCVELLKGRGVLRADALETYLAQLQTA